MSHKLQKFGWNMTEPIQNTIPSGLTNLPLQSLTKNFARRNLNKVSTDDILDFMIIVRESINQ